MVEINWSLGLLQLHIYPVDPDHQIVYLSPDMEQLTGKHSIVKFKTVLKVGIHSTSFKYNNMEEVDHMRSPPKEPNLASGVVTFLVTSHVSPELLSCANEVKF